MANVNPDEMVVINGVRYQPTEVPKTVTAAGTTPKTTTTEPAAEPVPEAKQAAAPRNKARTTEETATKEG